MAAARTKAALLAWLEREHDLETVELAHVEKVLDQVEDEGWQRSRDAANDTIAGLKETIDFLRQTYHRAHHDGPLNACRNNTCDAALKQLGKR